MAPSTEETAPTVTNDVTEETSKRSSPPTDDKEEDASEPKKAKVDDESCSTLEKTHAYGKLILFGEHFVVYKVHFITF
jgi:hypothetical protein